MKATTLQLLPRRTRHDRHVADPELTLNLGTLPAHRYCTSAAAARLVVLMLPAMLEGACTLRAYPGPRRPATELATVRSEMTVIETVDGRQVRDLWWASKAKFNILSGRHKLAAVEDRTGLEREDVFELPAGGQR